MENEIEQFVSFGEVVTNLEKGTSPARTMMGDDAWIIIAQHLDGVSLARASTVSRTLNRILSDDLWQNCFERDGFRRRRSGWGLGECDLVKSWRSEYSSTWLGLRSPGILQTGFGRIYRATPESIDHILMSTEDGDEVELSPGVYSTGLVISKNILLRGIGKREDIILRPLSGKTAIHLTAKCAILSCITVDVPDPGFASGSREQGAIAADAGSYRLLECDIRGTVLCHTTGACIEFRSCNLTRFVGAGALIDCIVRADAPCPATDCAESSAPPLVELRWGHTAIANCILDGAAAGDGGAGPEHQGPECGALVRAAATVALDGCSIRGCTVGLCVRGTSPPAAAARRWPLAGLFAADPPQLRAARCAVTDCRAAGVAVARAARVALMELDVLRCGAGLRVARWARPALDGCRLRDRAVPGSCVALEGCVFAECGGCGIEAMLDGGGLVRLLAPAGYGRA